MVFAATASACVHQAGLARVAPPLCSPLGVLMTAQAMVFVLKAHATAMLVLLVQIALFPRSFPTVHTTVLEEECAETAVALALTCFRATIALMSPPAHMNATHTECA